MLKKLNKRNHNLPESTRNILGIFFSSIIGALLTLTLTIIIAILLKNSPNLSKSTSILFIISIITGAFLTGFIASKKCSFKGLISGIISTLPFLIIITSVMLAFSEGKLIFSVLFIYISSLISSGIGGIISANTKRRK